MSALAPLINNYLAGVATLRKAVAGLTASSSWPAPCRASGARWK